MERHGKYLLLGLDSGDDLMVHLGMTGHLLVCDADAPVPKHTHIRAVLDDGRELRFDDARRFGRVAYGSREALIDARVMPRLGVEPLSDAFSQERLDAVLRKTTRTVKAALLDQKGVAGLGNIYIDEACFMAGRAADPPLPSAHATERAALLDAIRRVLTTRSPIAGAASMTIAMCGTRAAATRSGCRSTGAAGSRASCAARRCAGRRTPDARPCTARTASDDCASRWSATTMTRRSAARVSSCTACARRWCDAASPCTPSRVAASTRSRSPGAPVARRSIFSLQLNRYPQILTRAAPDVVHAHGGPGGVLIWKRTKVPARLHGPSHLPPGACARVREADCSRASRRAPTGSAAMVLPVSRSTANALLEMGVPASRIEVLSNGVDPVDVPGVEHEDGRVLFVEPARA